MTTFFLATIFLSADLISCNMLLSTMFSLEHNFTMKRTTKEQRLQILEWIREEGKLPHLVRITSRRSKTMHSENEDYRYFVKK